MRDPLFDFVGDEEPPSVSKRLLLTYSRANRKRRNPEEWNTAQLFIKAVDFLRENAGRDNFFLWLDCFDPHEPWDSPPDYVRLYDDTPGSDGYIDPRAFFPTARKVNDGEFPTGVRKRQHALYAAKVSWMDYCFGKVMDTLEMTGLADNTAIIFTADHGTNLGERGGFGKTVIVNEQEAHVPLLLHVPGMSPGRNNSIVQPQDIFTTTLSLAGVNPPENAVGFDLTGGKPTDRSLALGGLSVDSWRGDPQQIVFTVFDDAWYLNITADPAACRLFRYGSVDDVASENMDIVKRLRDKAWSELSLRDTNPELINWLSSGGTTTFSKEWAEWVGPPKWRRYWERVFVE